MKEQAFLYDSECIWDIRDNFSNKIFEGVGDHAIALLRYVISSAIDQIEECEDANVPLCVDCFKAVQKIEDELDIIDKYANKEEHLRPRIDVHEYVFCVQFLKMFQNDIQNRKNTIDNIKSKYSDYIE